ncbi:mitochondrial fission ELM1 family protein [Nitrospira sp. M1]
MSQEDQYGEASILCSDAIASARPVVWVLTDDRPGNSTQSLGLADALGWPYTVKTLGFSRLAWLHKVHERLLGATTICLDRDSSYSLVPPWPDVVISAGRRAAPVARWIRKQSQGKAKLIQLGRKGSQAVQLGDVSIAPGYCRMWPNEQRIETLAPLNRVTNQQLEEAAKEWPDLYDDAPRPHIVLLVGGSTVRNVLDESVARQLGKDVAEFAKKTGGMVHAVTSRRTGTQATEALTEGLGHSGVVQRWKPNQSRNPYWGYLATADSIIVTGDSESMVGESVSIGKPVFIYALPEKPLTLFARLREMIVVAGRASLHGEYQGSFWSRGFKNCSAVLVRQGIVRPLRDLKAFHRVLVEQGYACSFGQDYEIRTHRPLREAEVVSQKIKSLFGFLNS